MSCRIRCRRSRSHIAALARCLVAVVTICSLHQVAAEGLQLTLPPAVYAVPNVESAIYYDNIVLTQTSREFCFDVTCDLGKSEADRWVVTPAEGSQGEHPLSIKVLDADGNVLQSGKTFLHVASADAGAAQPLRLLIVGDSLTHATVYPNELSRLLAQDGNPKVTMLGTHRPTRAVSGVAHEGYGGWTWQRFISKYEPEPDGTHRKRSSPFVYLNEDRKPELNVKRYIAEECGGDPPDVVTFLLGINDCFSANPDDRDAIDDRIDDVFVYADGLLAAFSEAAPNAKLAVCLMTPPNSRQAAFEANYKDRYTRWGWKRIQHRLVQRQIEHYAGRQMERIYVVPTQLNLDPVGGYPPNNGVHPNEAGYKQIASSIYAWLKSEAFD